MKHIRLFFLTILVFAGLTPALASANPVDLYGMGARARGMGGAYTAVADDFSALYYNPAGLSQVKENRLEFGYMSAAPHPNLALSPAARTTARQRNSLDHLEGAQTDLPLVNAYEFGLLLAPHERFTGGLAAHVPTTGAVLLHPVDPHVPTFLLYDHYAERTTTFLGGAFTIIPGLAVGVGMTMFAEVDGRLNVPIRATNENLSLNPDKPAKEAIDLPSDLTIKFPWSVKPFGGVMYRPAPWLRLGGSYRAQFSWDVKVRAKLELVMKDYALDIEDIRALIPDLDKIRTVVRVSIPALGRTPIEVPVEVSQLSGTIIANLRLPLSALIAMEDFWQPQQASFGAAFEPTDQWTISTDATWYDWSQMASPDMTLKIDDINVRLTTLPANLRARIQSLTIPVLGTVGPLPEIAVSIPGVNAAFTIPLRIRRPTRPPAHDVIHPRLGMEYRFLPWRTKSFLRDIAFAVRGGYAYEPSPFDKDSGYTNIIDPDRHLLSTGIGVKLRNRFSLDSYFQYRYLSNVTVEKDSVDKSMPFTKMKADGYVLAGGLQAGISW